MKSIVFAVVLSSCAGINAPKSAAPALQPSVGRLAAMHEAARPDLSKMRPACSPVRERMANDIREALGRREPTNFYYAAELYKRCTSKQVECAPIAAEMAHAKDANNGPAYTAATERYVACAEAGDEMPSRAPGNGL